MKFRVLELFGGLKVKVSDDGKVYTLDHSYLRKNGRIDNRKGKQLKPKVDKYGYETIVLTKDGTRKNYTIHKLVALAYIPNPENKPTINHIDGNKLNNNVSNLEWATYKEQKIHAWNKNLAWNKRNSNGTFTRKEVMPNE